LATKIEKKKRIQYYYDSCLSFEELLKAHKMARSGKNIS
jgi:hypothetical protein